MTKEVVINLSEPVDELVILVGFLIRFLGSAPVYQLRKTNSSFIYLTVWLIKKLMQ